MMAWDTLDNLFTSGMTAKSKSTLAYVKLRSSNIAVSSKTLEIHFDEMPLGQLDAIAICSQSNSELYNQYFKGHFTYQYSNSN